MNHKNEEYFKFIFDKYCKKLIAKALWFIKNKQQSEDIALCAFHKLWVSENKFTNEHEIAAYLFTIVKNDCLNYIKHTKYAAGIKTSYAYEQNENQQPTIKDFMHPICKYVLKYFKMLSGNERKIMELTFYNQLEPLEISAQMGISHSSVGVLKNRAIKKIKSAILKYEN